MNSRLPKDIAAADADSGTTSPARGIRPGRRLIAVLLLAAAALDLIRCSLVPMAATHAAPAAGLIAAGLAAAILSVRTARGCQAGRRWSSWAALLIGATSAPQAAVAGFHSPYTIPDTATAALGVLLTVAVLVTAGRTEQPGHHTDNPCFITGSHPMSHLAAAPTPAHGARGATADARPVTGVRHTECTATPHQPHRGSGRLVRLP
jgi:peptidoglycan/LPS O-acetylase OafA/YrhL